MTHKLFEISIDDINNCELHDRLVGFLYGDKTKTITTPNAEMIIDALHNQKFARALENANLKLPDGVATRFAISALTDSRLEYRHTGADTFQEIIKICAQESKSILLLGAGDDVLQKAKQIIVNNNKVKVDTLNPGKVSIECNKIILAKQVFDDIRRINPDVIAIALSHKKQIIFMDQLRLEFPEVKIMIGIGGALDMISGKLRRAPKFMRKIGIEWLWRVLIEPSRIGRIMKATIVFPIIVISETIRKRIFFKAIYKTVPEIIKQLLAK